MLTQNTPNRPGYWIFKGLRSGVSKRFQTPVYTIVLVVDDPAFPEWKVAYLGTSHIFFISYHIGIWTYIGDLLGE